MRFILIVTLAVSCLFFYAPQTEAKTRTAGDKKSKQQVLDIDNNGLKEIVKIDDKSDAEGRFTVTVTSQKKEEIDSLSFAGKFKKIELVDLSGDDTKQLVVHYKDLDGFYNLAVYRLKDDTLTKIFSTKSIYGVDTEFDSTLPRIKVGKAKHSVGGGYSSDIPEWEIWVWLEDRFVKER